MKYVIRDKYRGWNHWTKPTLPYANSEMSIATFLKNGETRKHELAFVLKMEDSLNSNGFDAALYSHTFFLHYDWFVTLDGKKLLKVGDNNLVPRKVVGYDNLRTKKTERNYTKNLSFNGSQESSIFFVSDKNVVDINGPPDYVGPYGKDDTGSEVRFTHEIKRLELTPKP